FTLNGQCSYNNLNYKCGSEVFTAQCAAGSKKDQAALVSMKIIILFVVIFFPLLISLLIDINNIRQKLKILNKSKAKHESLNNELLEEEEKLEKIEKSVKHRNNKPKKYINIVD
ncbi:MAG: hypothetical protein MHPSP_003075, partial [Paramarteilia canceri]